MAPLAVKPHATTLLRPKGASEAGSRKTPEPIELPTTNATHIQKPSSGRCVMRATITSLALDDKHSAFDINAEFGSFPAVSSDVVLQNFGLKTLRICTSPRRRVSPVQRRRI